MSHQSGIKASDGLVQAYMEARASGKRIVKVRIVSEILESAGVTAAVGTDEADFSLIPGLLKPDEACYLLFQRDSDNAYGREWILFTFVPDRAPVKDKMLYASTRATLKKDLGDTYFSFDIHGTEANDFTLDSFNHYVSTLKQEAPLTESERQTRHETSQKIDMGGRSSGVHGVAFPVSAAGKAALEALNSGSGPNYVSLALDLGTETIELDKNQATTADGLQAFVPADAPRYHIFKYAHTHNGQQISPNVFIYSCPMGSKIKERMLYSSAKAGLLMQIEQLSINLEKKLEIADAEDLTAEYVNEEVHPDVATGTTGGGFSAGKESFARPAGPGGRKRPQRKK